MRILRQNKKEGIIKLKIDNLDDLLLLSRIVKKGDIVYGRTSRIVKKREEQEGKRVKLMLKLSVEKVEFKKNCLRILGRILESSNKNVPLGVFHTISLEIGEEIEIKKEWKNWQIKMISEAIEFSKRPKLLLCAADYGEAALALLREFGLEHITELLRTLPGKKEKKVYENARREFLIELAKLLEETSKNMNVKKIIVGGVGFFPENFKDILKNFPELKKKIFVFKISTSGKPGISELIRRGIVEIVVKESRIAEETKFIEKFFEEISKDGLAVYGVKEVKRALNYGAVKVLLISNEFVSNAEDIISMAEKSKARILIISDKHEAGERFSKFLIGALLRYKI